MQHCHHHIVEPISTAMFGIEGLGVVIALFIMGFTGSFMHCIGMCGPFAVAQTSMRLMNISSKQLSHKARLQASALFPYYIGKSITYCILLTVAFFVSENFKQTTAYRYLALFFLISAAFLFLKMAITRDFNFIRVPKLEKLLSNKLDLINTNGFKGLFTGMVLGLIPCGLVYGAIVTILSLTSNIAIAISAMFTFGLATIPGLFIVSYFGQYVVNKYKKYINYMFSIIMILNALFLLGYALKLI